MNKQYISLVLGVVMVGTFLIPQASFAAVSADNFCTRLSSRDADLDKATAQREASMELAQKSQLARIVKARADQDKLTDLARSQADSDFAKRIDNLTEKAKTQAQKDAVAKYQGAIAAAATTRRTAVDAAYATFRTGVDGTVADRQNAMKAVVANFIVAIDASVAQAKADCASNAKPATVQQKFQNALEQARSTFKTAKKALPDLDAKIVGLQTARMSAVEAARAVFKNAASAARKDLDNAFK